MQGYEENSLQVSLHNKMELRREKIETLLKQLDACEREGASKKNWVEALPTAVYLLNALLQKRSMEKLHMKLGMGESQMWVT